MSSAKDIQGTVFQNATATFMARVEDGASTNVTQSSIAAIRYTVSAICQNEGALQHSIMGHEDASISKADVIYDVLQTDANWTVDTTGYNFRHEIDVSQNEAFPKVGQVYQVRYEVTPVSGQKIVFRFRVRCI